MLAIDVKCCVVWSPGRNWDRGERFESRKECGGGHCRTSEEEDG